MFAEEKARKRKGGNIPLKVKEPRALLQNKLEEDTTSEIRIVAD